MCGSATLAIVVSSTCMIIASMMAAVSRPLFLTTSVGLRNGGGCGHVSSAVGLQRCRLGVDRDDGAHAGAQRLALGDRRR